MGVPAESVGFVDDDHCVRVGIGEGIVSVRLFVRIEVKIQRVGGRTFELLFGIEVDLLRLSDLF